MPSLALFDMLLERADENGHVDMDSMLAVCSQLSAKQLSEADRIGEMLTVMGTQLDEQSAIYVIAGESGEVYGQITVASEGEHDVSMMELLVESALNQAVTPERAKATSDALDASASPWHWRYPITSLRSRLSRRRLARWARRDYEAAADETWRQAFLDAADPDLPPLAQAGIALRSLRARPTLEREVAGQLLVVYPRAVSIEPMRTPGELPIAGVLLGIEVRQADGTGWGRFQYRTWARGCRAGAG